MVSSGKVVLHWALHISSCKLEISLFVNGVGKFLSGKDEQKKNEAEVFGQSDLVSPLHMYTKTSNRDEITHEGKEKKKVQSHYSAVLKHCRQDKQVVFCKTEDKG